MENENNKVIKAHKDAMLLILRSVWPSAYDPQADEAWGDHESDKEDK